MMRIYADMTKLKAGKRVRFRNGGISKVREVKHDGSEFYPITIRLNNFHASNTDPWCYDMRGMCGQQTGSGNTCPFDIMEVLR